MKVACQLNLEQVQPKELIDGKKPVNLHVRGKHELNNECGKVMLAPLGVSTGRTPIVSIFLTVREHRQIVVQLNREIFTTLDEAKVLIEQWRKEYNQVRPHSARNNHPPAPEAILTMTTT